MAKKRLSFREYWNHVGTENIERIADFTGSSIAYLRGIKYGTKKPGEEIIDRIMAGAAKVTPGWAPDRKLMLAGDSTRVGRVIAPSKQFVATKKRRR